MLLTLVPLLLAGVVTLEICVLIGMPLNFANIIALPLLLGVGVAFKIYYIMAWRAGGTNLLQSSLTRAVFFSALTTATAFGSLWMSSHPGTSSMGKLLVLSLVMHDAGGGAVPAGPHGATPRHPVTAARGGACGSAMRSRLSERTYRRTLGLRRRRRRRARPRGAGGGSSHFARVQVSPPHRKPSTQPSILSAFGPAKLTLPLYVLPSLAL